MSIQRSRTINGNLTIFEALGITRTPRTARIKGSDAYARCYISKCIAKYCRWLHCRPRGSTDGLQNTASGLVLIGSLKMSHRIPVESHLTSYLIIAEEPSVLTVASLGILSRGVLFRSCFGILIQVSDLPCERAQVLYIIRNSRELICSWS